MLHLIQLARSTRVLTDAPGARSEARRKSGWEIRVSD
jgi:hypothetical protein